MRTKPPCRPQTIPVARGAWLKINMLAGKSPSRAYPRLRRTPWALGCVCFSSSRLSPCSGSASSAPSSRGAGLAVVGGLDTTQHRSTGTVIAVSDKDNRVIVQLDDNTIPWVDILPDNASIPDLSEPVTFDFSGYAIADLGWVTPGSTVVVTYWWSASQDGTLSAWNIEPLTSSAPDAAAPTSQAP